MEIAIGLALLAVIVIYFLHRRSSGRGLRRSPKTPTIPKGLSEEDLEAFYDRTLNQLASGELGAQFRSNLLLKKGERLLLEIPGIQLCEERSVKIRGGYQGFSVRIMKGVSYRFGGFSGGSEQRVVPIDVGSFTLTNKRFVFAGQKRSVECALAKIVSVDRMQDGIAVSRSGKAKTEYYVGIDALTLSATVEAEPGEQLGGNKIEWVFTGEEFRRLVQKLLQEE